MIKDRYLRKVVAESNRREITTKMVERAEILRHIDRHEAYDALLIRQLRQIGNAAAPLPGYFPWSRSDAGLGNIAGNLGQSNAHLAALYQCICPYCGK